MTYFFESQDAVVYGLNEAVFLQNIRFWVATNKANKTNNYPVSSTDYPELAGQERTWTYNSVEAFVELFPFWTKRQIRTIIDSLLLQKALIKGDYNKDRTNRTTWYALYDESICQKRQMDLSKKANVDLSDLTNDITDNKLQIQNNSLSGEPDTSNSFVLNNEKNEKRKSCGKKKKEPKCIRPEARPIFIEMFCQFYEKRQMQKYDFKDIRDGELINRVIVDLDKRFKEVQNKEGTDEDLLKSFAMVLEEANSEDWHYLKHIDLPSLYKNLNAFISNLKKKRANTTKTTTSTKIINPTPNKEEFGGKKIATIKPKENDNRNT